MIRRRALLAGVVVFLAAGCENPSGSDRTVLRFWAMGREGEVVQELVPQFERENPGVRVEVQQIPWSAAHEKLLTSHVGRSTPDLAQLGNTWIAEFVALRALEPLDSRIAASERIDSGSYFTGIWNTNVIDSTAYGIPWYVDTRVLFYRTDILERAGYTRMPGSWRGWREAMEAVKREVGADRYAIFLPMNEWTQIAILGLQSGSPLLAEDATRGAFAEPEFRTAFAFYLDLYRDDLAPPVSNTEIANVYQEFARGRFAMYITGPWNLGEFRRRLPEELQDDWATAPLPGPGSEEHGVSLAGGASLVIFRDSPRKEAAWKLIEFLSRPSVQAEFYRLSGDLPVRKDAWGDPTLRNDDKARAFEIQLSRTVSTPKIPEWEQIAMRLQQRAEQAVRSAIEPESALAALDSDVDRILEKRRWLLERKRRGEDEGRP